MSTREIKEEIEEEFELRECSVVLRRISETENVKIKSEEEFVIEIPPEKVKKVKIEKKNFECSGRKFGNSCPFCRVL